MDTETTAPRSAYKTFHEIHRRLTKPMERVACPMCGEDLLLAAYVDHGCFVEWRAAFDRDRERHQEKKVVVEHSRERLAADVREYIKRPDLADDAYPTGGLAMSIQFDRQAITLATADGPVAITVSKSPRGSATNVLIRVVAPRSVLIGRLRVGALTAPTC